MHQLRNGMSKTNVFITLLLVLAPLGCSSNLIKTLLSNNLSNNTVTVPPNRGGVGNGAFTISRIVPDPYDSNTIDIIGDGSGAIGTTCVPTNSAGSSSGASTVCNCTFQYSASTNLNQRADIPISYNETDMARCSISSIPKNITSIAVSIHVINSDEYTNQINYSFQGTGITLNPNDPASFSMVSRFQCRDKIVIPYFLDPSIYDPIQSENPYITAPLNFYTTNIYNSIVSFAAASGQYQQLSTWECPPILDPDQYLNPISLANFNKTYQNNMNIYSKAPLSGSWQIYPPPSGIFDRSTFYLSKKSSGVFNVPVNAYFAPGLITQQGGTYPPIGYGAQPISSGANQETCPDTATTIPPGYHWVKVWLFRASLPSRTSVTPNSNSNSFSQITSIACNPGIWLNTTTPKSPAVAADYNPVFAGCYRTSEELIPNTINYANALISTDTNLGASPLIDPISGIDNGTGNSKTYFAERVIGYRTGSVSCVKLQDITGQIIKLPCSPNSTGAGCNPDGSDTWSMNLPIATENTNTNWACAPGSVIDPFTPSTQCSSASLTIATPQPTTFIPSSTAVQVNNLDASSNRYDFIFVVTPTTVMVNDMLNSDSSLAYQPLRYQTYLDCTSSNYLSDCSSPASKVISNYGIKLHDVGNNGDPSGNDPSRPGVFPVCAIQPNSP